MDEEIYQKYKAEKAFQDWITKEHHKEKTSSDSKIYGRKFICICGHKKKEHIAGNGRPSNKGACWHEDVNSLTNFGDGRDLIRCQCKKFLLNSLPTLKSRVSLEAT